MRMLSVLSLANGVLIELCEQAVALAERVHFMLDIRELAIRNGGVAQIILHVDRVLAGGVLVLAVVAGEARAGGLNVVVGHGRDPLCEKSYTVR